MYWVYINRQHEKCLQGKVEGAESVYFTPANWSRELLLQQGVNPVKYMQQQTQITGPNTFYLELSQFLQDMATVQYT